MADNDVQNLIMQQYLKELFKSPEETERNKLLLGQARTSITPLTTFENNFSNRWNRASQTGGLEDVEVLEKLKTSNKNLYNSMTVNMSADKKIPMTDSYDRNAALIEKQIGLVNDYNTYKAKINIDYGELETALFHNATTLDSLGKVHAEGFDNWEDMYINGTDEQVSKFIKDIQPHLVKNGESISKIMQKIVLSEKELAKYGKFSDIEYTARDVGLLRNIASGLGQELRSTTFLTDKEAKGLQTMWIEKDPRAYLEVKTKQKAEADIILRDLKAEKTAYVKREADLISRLRVMKEGGKEDAIDIPTGLSYKEISTERMNLSKAIKDIDFKILRTGEFGASIGLGGDIALSPISEAATKYLASIPPPITPPIIKKKKKVTPQPAVVPEETVDIDAIISAHADAFTGIGFSRTKVGNDFKKEHGLNNAIMTKLKDIESTKNVGGPRVEEDIAKYKKDISNLLDVESTKNLKKIRNKTVGYFRAYSKGNKIPPDKIAIMRKAYPNIDKYIAEWKNYGGRSQFPVWLRGRIEEGKADKIDYNKFKGIL